MKTTQEEIEELDYVTCPLCQGSSNKMGALGNLFWYRCQLCGVEFSIKIEGSEQNEKQTD